MRHGSRARSPDDRLRDCRIRSVGAFGRPAFNSHTKGEYLDDPKFWVIFEKAQELDVPVYIHPRVPGPDMVKPYQEYFGLEAAAYGFPMDASLQALRLILSGVFDDYHYEAPLMLSHKVLGPDRIMFAVDYPFEEIEEPVRAMDNAPISDEDNKKTYQTNAERVVRL